MRHTPNPETIATVLTTLSTCKSDPNDTTTSFINIGKTIFISRPTNFFVSYSATIYINSIKTFPYISRYNKNYLYNDNFAYHCFLAIQDWSIVWMLCGPMDILPDGHRIVLVDSTAVVLQRKDPLLYSQWSHHCS